MNRCIFCQISNKKAPAKIIFENENVICLLPKEIEVYGHTLVIPKKHYADLYDIPTDTLCDLVKAVQKLTIEYKKKINATGMNLLHASGKDGQQSVPHFHFHLFPRFKGDGLDTWPNLAKIEVDIEKLYNKLRAV
ncbi:MAG: HIT family protein [Patescibacteria group bacterium]